MPGFWRDRALGDTWLLGLIARFAFAAVLWNYFLNSAEPRWARHCGFLLHLSPGAYYQIAYPAVEAAGGDVGAVSFFPWGLIVVWAPMPSSCCRFCWSSAVLADCSFGNDGFHAVQTFVDITVHQIGAESIGTLFDRFPDAVIADQRLLWMVPLLVIALKGPGLLSVDALLARRRQGSGQMIPRLNTSHSRSLLIQDTKMALSLLSAMKPVPSGGLDQAFWLRSAWACRQHRSQSRSGAASLPRESRA
jgi:putative oxidoreductase